MKRIATLRHATAVLFLLLVLPLHAAHSTRVTSGTLTFQSNVGSIDLSGQSGFRLQSMVSGSAGRFAPASQCEFLDCPPGTEISLAAEWSGQDLRGTASLRGKDYALGSETADGALGVVHFDGSVTAPPFNDSGTVQVSAPFAFSGQLAYPGDAVSTVEPLSGQGIATLTLVRSADGSSWVFQSASYQFQSKR